MKTALVLGAGGFIGTHLVTRLKKEGFWVRAVDLKYPEFSETTADEFIIADLRNPSKVSLVMFAPHQKSIDDNINSFDEVYQLAADMGGAGFVFTGEHDADIMHNSALVNLNIVAESVTNSVKKIFYSSSACMYPEHNQLDSNNPNLAEESAYPANPDSEYGWEKLFSERLYLSYHRNYGLNIRIARFHNIFGTEGTWQGGREKAPAALCRKIASTPNNEIEMWGDGKQTRSFLYIDDCLNLIRMLMDSDWIHPVNIGSDEMITINNLALLISDIAKKTIKINHIEGPTGVRGRNSDNRLFQQKIGKYDYNTLKLGIVKTYDWISKQIKN